MFDSQAGKVSFVMETMHSKMRLIGHCGMLVAHPAQRSEQARTMEKIDISEAYLQTLRANVAMATIWLGGNLL